MSGLTAYLAARTAQVEAVLAEVLPAEGGESPDLVAAMRYSVLAGGKRLRPILFLAAAEALGVPEPALPELTEAACGLEMIHTYSLIHDDLPCMDDDSLRRGKPTCHVVFGEATALLAGDALQSLGFELLATRPAGPLHAARRAEAVALVARGIGVHGMAGGQALDLFLTAKGDVPDAEARLREIHSLKTGALLRVSLVAGALHAGADGPARDAMARYGEALGLLFQIADDLLDTTASEATLGKTAGKDAAQRKLTYPGLFGLDGARRRRDDAFAAAETAARALPGEAGRLVELARYAGFRDR